MRVLRLLLKGLLLAVPLALLLVRVNYAVDGSAILRGDKYELEIATAWLDGKAVGIIRVVWHFDPIEDVPEGYYGYQLDDCYFVVENGTLTPITDTELYERGGNPASFIVGEIGKYSQYGKTYAPNFP